MVVSRPLSSVESLNELCVPLAIKAIMISFKVSDLDLIALKRNSVKILNNAIMIVLIAKGTQDKWSKATSHSIRG